MDKENNLRQVWTDTVIAWNPVSTMDISWNWNDSMWKEGGSRVSPLKRRGREKIVQLNSSRGRVHKEQGGRSIVLCICSYLVANAFGREPLDTFELNRTQSLRHSYWQGSGGKSFPAPLTGKQWKIERTSWQFSVAVLSLWT